MCILISLQVLQKLSYVFCNFMFFSNKNIDIHAINLKHLIIDERFIFITKDFHAVVCLERRISPLLEMMNSPSDRLP